MKLPVAHTLGNREASLDQDALMRNALAEPSESEGVVKARKRPAIESAYSVESGTGQALLTWTIADPDGDEEVLVAISDDIINTAPTALTKALRFAVQPTDPYLGDAIDPAVTVRVVDQAGNTVTGSSANVTVSLGTNPTTATLGGTLTQAASSGVATFNDLELNRSGADFKLAAASSGLLGATSNAFSIATQLVFTDQPTSGDAGETLDPIEVTSQDLDGNTDTNFTGDVTLSIYSGTPGELSGTLTVSAVAGVATFSNVEISDDGTYTLKASCDESGNNLDTAYKPASGISNSITIGPYTLVAGQTNIGGSVLTGFSVGSAIGSLTPSTFNGVSITVVVSSDGGGVVPEQTSVIMSSLVAQDFFDSISINGIPLLTSAATYTQPGGSTTSWGWSGVQLMTVLATYSVVFA